MERRHHRGREGGGGGNRGRPGGGRYGGGRHGGGGGYGGSGRHGGGGRHWGRRDDGRNRGDRDGRHTIGHRRARGWDQGERRDSRQERVVSKRVLDVTPLCDWLRQALERVHDDGVRQTWASAFQSIAAELPPVHANSDAPVAPHDAPFVAVLQQHARWSHDVHRRVWDAIAPVVVLGLRRAHLCPLAPEDAAVLDLDPDCAMWLPLPRSGMLDALVSLWDVNTVASLVAGPVMGDGRMAYPFRRLGLRAQSRNAAAAVARGGGEEEAAAEGEGGGGSGAVHNGDIIVQQARQGFARLCTFSGVTREPPQSFRVQPLHRRIAYNGPSFAHAWSPNGLSHSSEATWKCFISTDEHWRDMDVITDLFAEGPRLRARVRSNNSPVQEWSQCRTRANTLRAVLSQRGNRGSVTALELREAMWKETRECTQFKCSFARSVLELVGATRVLDPSAGWGDRLVAAVACPTVTRYLGYDPNTALQRCHAAMLKSVCSNASHGGGSCGGDGDGNRDGVDGDGDDTLDTPAMADGNRYDDDDPDDDDGSTPHGDDDATDMPAYHVVYEPFETAQLPPDTLFDCVLTSPPFFDFEVYTEDVPGQSLASYPVFAQWLTCFLFTSLQRAWSVLEPGGTLILYLADSSREPCCEVTNMFIQAVLPHAVYCGVIGSAGSVSGKTRPAWVWRRLEDRHDAERQQQALHALEQHWPHVFHWILERKQ